jgi:hypothetical protein
MTLVGHFLAADVRRLRVILAIWIVVAAASRLVESGTAVYAARADLRESFAVLSSLLWLAELLLTFVLVSQVVHAHPTVGTDAFWLTRPIPRYVLLVSKLVLLAVALVVVPAIVDVLRLALHNMPASVTAGVAAQNASSGVVWLALIAAAAALTANLTRFALLIGGALLAMAVAIGIFVAVAMARLSDAPPLTSESSDAGFTEVVVFNAVLALAALALLVVQYRTRSRPWSVTTGVVGVAVAVVVSWLWPIPFLAPRLVVPEWARDERVLSVGVDASTISTNTERLSGPERNRQWSTINGRIRVNGLQPGWTASVAAREATVRLPDGQTIQSEGSLASNLVWWDGVAAQPSAALRAVLGVSHLVTANPPPAEPARPALYPALFLMEQSRFDRYAPSSGEYRARVRVMLTEFAVEGTLPLRPGAAHQDGGYRLVLDSIAHSSGEVSMIAREARAASMWQRRPWSLHSFYLRNRGQSEALELSEYPLRGSFTLTRFLPIAGVYAHGEGNGFFTRAVRLTFPARDGRYAGPSDRSPAWLGNAELVIVRRTAEGSVERAVTIPAFPFGHSRELTTRQ